MTGRGQVQPKVGAFCHFLFHTKARRGIGLGSKQTQSFMCGPGMALDGSALTNIAIGIPSTFLARP